MRALVMHGPEDMRVETRPVPSPAAGQVLVEVGSVGVCGSDRHFYFEGRASSDVIDGPAVLGHEFGGTIVEVGAGVDAGRVGERVSVEPLVPDPDSAETKAGRYNIDPAQTFYGVPYLDGGLERYVAVPSANAYAIPDSVSDDQAALVEPISVSLNGVRKARIGLGSRVLVTGGGPIGLFAAQLALLEGAEQVAVVEPNAERRRTAESFGCRTFAALAEAGDSYDSAIECTGVDSVRHDCCLAVVPGGRVVFIGVGSEDASVPMKAIIEREVSVRGVMRYRFTWPTVIELLASGRIKTDALISRRLPLDEAVSAWTDPLPTDVKVIIRPGE
jgi:L-iditol 2-dehydrogenase